jgi:hypothetical protein
LDSDLSRGRNPEAAYRAAQAAATGEQPGGGSGFELEHTDDPVEDTELTTSGPVPEEFGGVTTGGSDSLVTRGNVPKDSNLTAGGQVTGL